jgi:hypothetical protein
VGFAKDIFKLLRHTAGGAYEPPEQIKKDCLGGTMPFGREAGGWPKSAVMPKATLGLILSLGGNIEATEHRSPYRGISRRVWT